MRYPLPVNASVVQCPSCGAAVIRAPGAPSVCVFCGSTVVVVPEGHATDRLVPFRVSEEEARRRVRAWLSAQPLLLPAVRQAPFGLRPVFVPFHVFDTAATTAFSGRFGLDHVVRDHRRTEWFEEGGTLAFRAGDHLVSASRGLSEAWANGLEPFDLGTEVPFDGALTAGTEVECVSVPAAEASATARREVERRAAQELERTLRIADRTDAVTAAHEVTAVPTGTVALPVWVVRLDARGGPYRLLCNGQSGEVVGTLTPEIGRLALLSLLGVAGFLAAVGLLVAAAGAVTAALAAAFALAVAVLGALIAVAGR